MLFILSAKVNKLSDIHNIFAVFLLLRPYLTSFSLPLPSINAADDAH